MKLNRFDSDLSVIEAFLPVTVEQFNTLNGHQLRVFPIRFFSDKRFPVFTSREEAVGFASNSLNWNKKYKNILVTSFLLEKEKLKDSFIDNKIIFNKEEISLFELFRVNSSLIGLIQVDQLITLDR